MYKEVPLKYKKSCKTLAAKTTVSKLNQNVHNLNSCYDQKNGIPRHRISVKNEHISNKLSSSNFYGAC